jgi:hypothetical protein
VGYNWGNAYVNGCVVLAEGLDMYRPLAIATEEKMNPLGKLSFTKITLVVWISGCFTQKG